MILLTIKLNEASKKFLIELFKADSNLIGEVIIPKFDLTSCENYFVFAKQMTQLLFYGKPRSLKNELQHFSLLFTIYNRIIMFIPRSLHFLLKFYVLKGLNNQLTLYQPITKEIQIKKNYLKLIDTPFIDNIIGAADLNTYKFRSWIALVTIFEANIHKELYIKIAKAVDQITKTLLNTGELNFYKEIISYKEKESSLENYFKLNKNTEEVIQDIDKNVTFCLDYDLASTIFTFLNSIQVHYKFPYFDLLSNIMINGYKNGVSIINQSIINFADVILPICIKQEHTVDEEIILLKNFVYNSNKKINKDTSQNMGDIIEIINTIKLHFRNFHYLSRESNNKYYSNKSKEKVSVFFKLFESPNNKHILDFCFNMLINFKELAFIFSTYNKLTDDNYLLFKYMNNFISNNVVKRQILLIKYPPQLILDTYKIFSILNTKSIISFNIFSFLLDFDNKYKAKHINLYVDYLQNIEKNKLDNVTDYTNYSKYVQEEDPNNNLKNIIKSSVGSNKLLEKFLHYFESFIENCIKSNFDLNNFLKNKTYAECFARILYHILLNFTDYYFDTKLIVKFNSLISQFSQLFDYVNKYNLKLLKLSIQMFIKTYNKNKQLYTEKSI